MNCLNLPLTPLSKRVYHSSQGGCGGNEYEGIKISPHSWGGRKYQKSRQSDTSWYYPILPPIKKGLDV